MATNTQDTCEAGGGGPLSLAARTLPVPHVDWNQVTDWISCDLPNGLSAFRAVHTGIGKPLLVRYFPFDSSQVEWMSEAESQLTLWHSVLGPQSRLLYADLTGDRPYVAWDGATDLPYDRSLESLEQPLQLASRLLNNVNHAIRARLYHGCIGQDTVQFVAGRSTGIYLNYLERYFLTAKLGERQTVFELYRNDVVQSLNLAIKLSLQALQSDTIRDHISSREQAMLKRLCREGYTLDTFDDVFERWLDYFESHVDTPSASKDPVESTPQALVQDPTSDGCAVHAAHLLVPKQSLSDDTQDGSVTPVLDLEDDDSNTSISDEPNQHVASSASMVGKQLDRFQLVRLIGSGGMGAVYEGLDPTANSPVAIKVLQAQGPNAAQAIRRFNKESRILASIRNEHVTQLYEIGESEGIHYIVMELVSGTDLKKWLKQRGMLAESLALRIVRDIAKALIEAHERGIIHRDIKPENVLLAGKPANTDSIASDSNNAWTSDEDFTVKLTDFGIARQIQQTQSMEVTRQGGILGTPKYMSPEQCKGNRVVEATTDIYSLGITLYELLAGQVPFDDPDMMKLAAMHCFEPAPDIQKRNQSVSQSTRELIWKMLAKDPTRRPANASQLVDEIDRLLEGEPNAFELHPHLPAFDSKKVWERVFEWDLKSDPESLWPHVSNTERLNRAAGLPPVTYKTTKDPERGIRRFGSFRLGGLSIEWEEHPFEWIEGQRLGVLREFSTGPFKWFMNTVELKANPDGGTHLVHRVKIEPRNSLGRIVSTVEAGWKGGRALDRVYRNIDAVLSASDENKPQEDFFGEDVSLARNKKQRILTRVEQMQAMGASLDASQLLADYLLHAPMQEVNRIRPYPMATRWGISEDETIDTLLIASACGVLDIQWEVICPTCRVAAKSHSLLTEIQQHTQCESCDTQFQSNKANAIELTFRANPEVRETTQEKYCIGGPWHAPHVVAQLRLASHERMSIPLRLDAGDYLIRWPGALQPQVLFVRPSASATRLDIELSRNTNAESSPSLREGLISFSIKNHWDREISLRIERLNDRSTAVTAATAFALPRFRELFPEQTFSNEFPVTTESLTLLEVQLFGVEELYDRLGEQRTYELCNAILAEQSALIASSRGAIAKRREDGIVACFLDCVDACRAALVMQQHFENVLQRFVPRSTNSSTNEASLRLGIGIHRGRTLLAQQNGIVDYFGKTMRQTTLIAQKAEGSVLLSDPVASDPSIRALLQEHGTPIHLTKLITGRDTPLIVGRIDLS